MGQPSHASRLLERPFPSTPGGVMHSGSPECSPVTDSDSFAFPIFHETFEGTQVGGFYSHNIAAISTLGGGDRERSPSKGNPDSQTHESATAGTDPLVVKNRYVPTDNSILQLECASVKNTHSKPIETDESTLHSWSASCGNMHSPPKTSTSKPVNANATGKQLEYVSVRNAHYKPTETDKGIMHPWSANDRNRQSIPKTSTSKPVNANAKHEKHDKRNMKTMEEEIKKKDQHIATITKDHRRLSVRACFVFISGNSFLICGASALFLLCSTRSSLIKR